MTVQSRGKPRILLAAAMLLAALPAGAMRAAGAVNAWQDGPDDVVAVGDGEEIVGDEADIATNDEALIGERTSSSSGADEEEYFESDGCCQPDDCCPPTRGVALTIGVPMLCPGFKFHAGILYLQPSADNLGWGVLTNELNEASPAPIASPYWTIESLTPGYAPGFELGGGYTFGCTGRDVQLNYQHLRTNTTDAAAVNQSTGEWISPFSQTGPPTAEVPQDMIDNTGVNLLLSADAQVKFAYDAVNLDFGQFVSIGQSLTLRLFAGVSYAKLQERLYSNFYGVPPSSTAPFPENVPLRISLDNTTSYWGLGPRFGFDSSYQTRHGLRLTGQLAGALLVGQTQPAQYVFTATAPDLAAVGITENYEQVGSEAYSHVVLATDARLGIGYTRVLRGGAVVTVDTGYLAAIYLNPFAGNETNSNVLALQSGSLSSGSVRHIQQSDFSLNGFYLNAGVNW